MISQTGLLGHYLGSFILYTLGAIALIYAVYWYTRRYSGAGMFSGIGRTSSGKIRLEIESNLTLEARKNLYVIRAGHERFLVATTMEGTQFLSRLESPESDIVQTMPAPHPENVERYVESAEDGSVDVPWFTGKSGSIGQIRDARSTGRAGRFGSRLVESVQWLMDARK